MAGALAPGGSRRSMQNFRDLKVWAKAHAVALSVYAITRNFPVTERYGLTAQMRRAAASVPANIAEGCGRSTPADFARFLHIAMGSASELEYFLILALDLGFVEEHAQRSLLSDTHEVKRMLTALTARLTTDD
jgi:four helix bundle protein